MSLLIDMDIHKPPHSLPISLSILRPIRSRFMQRLLRGLMSRERQTRKGRDFSNLYIFLCPLDQKKVQALRNLAVLTMICMYMYMYISISSVDVHVHKSSMLMTNILGKRLGFHHLINNTNVISVKNKKSRSPFYLLFMH